MGTPARFLSGIGTAPYGTNLGNFPFPDPTEKCVAFYDFNQYVAGDWTVTNTTSHATIGLVAASATVPAGGVVGLVGGASSANNDVAAIQANPANFYLSSTQECWFYAHLKLDVALNNQIILGVASDVSTAAPTDGMYFTKAAGAATVNFVVRKSSTSTTATTVATLADATSVELGFYYNGKNAVDVFVNEKKVYSQTTLTNLPTAVALAPALCMKLAATAPTTAYAYSDFILSAQDRNF
jgi:hypothetical protein